MSRRYGRMLRAGAAGTAALAVTVAGYWVSGDITPDHRAGYCAELPDAAGLYAGNPVTQMGYRVGEIERVEPKGERVLVSFVLDGGRRYPLDVKAVTRSKSLLADRSLELVGNYDTGPELVAGQCIPLAHSFTPKSIAEIAGSAADFIDALAPEDSEGLRAAVIGLDDALRGNGDNARAMLLHASAAASDPDRLVADIGASIENMAPLTEDALRHWATIRSIMDQLPTVAAVGIDLWPSVEQVARGVGWLTAVLYDIQRNYGAEIWPFAKGTVADVVHLAATRSGDLAELLDTLPAAAAVLRQQSADAALTLEYDGRTGTALGLFDLIIAEANR
ncbi:MlaD family protein [Nocardia bovistercoris]|uniref:MCE family protein n=1 Tax=Nocardia bovistercoris TaxID=2785916 RepID=A0A931N2G4_9NOCA|nr:MlaD family protein [Nocardia bovistercoris]MBH0776707.1 MCE family protein [Nocardia bovistercoris]